MLTLDGSTLEGGGQLVRVALSISAIEGIPVRITNIRAKRSSRSKSGRHGNETKAKKVSRGGGGGGLKESHLAALNWLAEKCGAQVQGDQVGCCEVVFQPGRRKLQPPSERNHGQVETVELKNPGSVWLVWQAIFPYIVFSMLDRTSHQHRDEDGTSAGQTASSRGLQEQGENVDDSPDSRSEVDGTDICSQSKPAFRVLLKGGTNVPKSPSSEYMQQVFLPLCEKIGLPRVDVRVHRRGWAGSAPDIGEVEISVYDNKLQNYRSQFHLPAFQLPTAGLITYITMTILAGSPETHALLESQLRTSLRAVPAFSIPSLPITLHESSGPSGDERRLYVLLVAHSASGHRLGRDRLGPGRKIVSEADRRRVVAEVVGHVVREFADECQRHGEASTSHHQGEASRYVLDGCDEFAEDQLVIFQALADGATKVHGGGNSLHTRTVRWVCQEMLGTVFDETGGCEGRRTVDNGRRSLTGHGVDEVDQLDKEIEDLGHWRGLGMD